MLKLLSHKYVIWTLLALPLPFLVAYQVLDFGRQGFAFYWTGVLSAVFAIASLSVTPITRLFPRAPWRLWLTRQRRYLGVAAFGYVAAHTGLWLIAAPLKRIVTSLWDPVISIAWISLVIYTALALTSNRWSVAKLGKNWKRLQQWTYLATFLGLVHWFWAHQFPVSDIVIYGGLFVVLMIFRILYRFRPASSL